jgi:RNA polymerase sigma factor (sigma-70 family)
MTEDDQLLRRYAEFRSEEAFAELVRRRIGLVYSVAFRRTRDAHRAEDVAQAVFTDLARKAASLSHRTVLVGWLYRSAHFAATDVVRAELSRTRREMDAHIMQEVLRQDDPDPAWEKLRPVLDQVLSELNEHDRDAILLRFFDGRPFADIGARLHLSENAARMRVERALDKLHALLSRRGITSTTAALGTILAQQATAATPAGLAATVTGAAMASVGAASTIGVLQLITTTKMASVTAGFALMILVVEPATYLVAKHRFASEIALADASQGREFDSLRAENRQLKDRLTETSASNVGTTPPAPSTNRANYARIASELIQSGLLGQMTWPNPDQNSLAAGMNDLSEILGLTPTERAALQQAAERGKQEFSVAVLAHASVQRYGAMVTITLKEEPDVRAAYNRMLDSMAAVLGPERYSYYESLGAKAVIEKLFSRWGLEPSTVMVAHSTVIPDAFYPPQKDAKGNPLPLSPRRLAGDPSGRSQYYVTQRTEAQQSFGAFGTDTIEHVGSNIGPLQALIPPDL